MTFASLFTVLLTLAFTGKMKFSLLHAFGSGLLELPFLISAGGLTFFGSALASRFHGPSSEILRHDSDYQKSTKFTNVRCSMLPVT